MLTREEVERAQNGLINARIVTGLATDWLAMHDALRQGVRLSLLHEMAGERHVEHDRAHHKRHDENREALERRINEGLREVAGLRERLAAIEQRTRGDEE